MWELVEQDLLEVYGIDLDQVMATVTWVWLQNKISGLFTRPKTVAPDGTLIPTTRLGWHFFPPQPQSKKQSTSQ